MIRELMRLTFPKIMDALFVLALVGVLVMAIMYAQAASFMGMGQGFTTFIVTLCLGILAVIVSFGVIYVLLDIRDSLHRIGNETKNMQEEKV